MGVNTKYAFTRATVIITITIIVTLAVLLGVLTSFLWGVIEKKLHPIDYSAYITQYSTEYNVPEPIIYAVIKVESDFDPHAHSNAGARGLMQMLPSTFEWLTGDEHLDEHLNKTDLFDPEVSIRYGTYYLRYLYQRFNYDWDVALAAYNGGEGNVAKWLKDSRYSDDGITLKDIPFDETKNYVKKVNKEIEAYKSLYYEQNEVKE